MAFRMILTRPSSPFFRLTRARPKLPTLLMRPHWQPSASLIRVSRTAKNLDSDCNYRQIKELRWEEGSNCLCVYFSEDGKRIPEALVISECEPINVDLLFEWSNSSRHFLSDVLGPRPDAFRVAFRDWLQCILISSEILSEKLKACPADDAASQAVKQYLGNYPLDWTFDKLQALFEFEHTEERLESTEIVADSPSCREMADIRNTVLRLLGKWAFHNVEEFINGLREEKAFCEGPSVASFEYDAGTYTKRAASAEDLPEAFGRYIFDERIDGILREIERSPMPYEWRSLVLYIPCMLCLGWQERLARTIPAPVQKLLRSIQPPTLADLRALALTSTGDAGVYARVMNSPTGASTRNIRTILRLRSVLESSKNAQWKPTSDSHLWGLGKLPRLAESEWTSCGRRNEENTAHVTLMTIPEPMLHSMSLLDARHMIILAEAVLTVWLGAPHWASRKLRQASPWPDTMRHYTVSLEKKNPLVIRETWKKYFALQKKRSESDGEYGGHTDI